ncbi:hippurate hydrolase [Pseudomonas sp. NFACC39-1]|nr:hippurate hydrolase [Pseudomonas sp. NFACC39-1]SFG86009.1 hippurate hydrolase [Pseudomonas sp. NFACC45]
MMLSHKQQRHFVNKLIKLRQVLHRIPELAYQEVRTSDVICEALGALGIPFIRGLAKTGVVGIITKGNAGPCIAVRADMDALPITERNTFGHVSQHPGCMHACGHDGHMAMLIGAAELINRFVDFNGTVCLIFQPAEEGQAGAKAMLDDGLLERFPIQAIAGLHNWPSLPAGSFATRPGALMASSNKFEIHLDGRGGHAAQPHIAINPINAAAQLCLGLQSLVASEVNALEAAVVTVTEIKAGNGFNVIPERVSIRGTVRAFDSLTVDRLASAIERMSEGIAQAFGCRGTVDFRRSYPALINCPFMVDLGLEAARQVFAEPYVQAQAQASMAAEDFAFFSERIPGVFAFLGSARRSDDPPLHSAHYDFNDAILYSGAAWFAAFARTCFEAMSSAKDLGGHAYVSDQ